MNYPNMANSLFNSLIPNTNKREILSVNGVSEARNFYLDKGENIILRDRNEDIIYVKACDDMGKCTLKIYSCVDITDQKINEETSVNITKADLDKLTNQLSDVKKMFMEAMNEHNVKRNASESDRTNTAVCK